MASEAGQSSETPFIHPPGEGDTEAITAIQPAHIAGVVSPLPNYTLSTLCPACGADTYRLACKVRCERCGFVWDCSEL